MSGEVSCLVGLLGSRRNRGLILTLPLPSSRVRWERLPHFPEPQFPHLRGGPDHPSPAERAPVCHGPYALQEALNTWGLKHTEFPLGTSVSFSVKWGQCVLGEVWRARITCVCCGSTGVGGGRGDSRSPVHRHLDSGAAQCRGHLQPLPQWSEASSKYFA